MQALFHEQNAKNYGSATATNYEDYYTIELHDDTAVYDEETEIGTFSVCYHGEIMETTEHISCPPYTLPLQANTYCHIGSDCTNSGYWCTLVSQRKLYPLWQM